MLKIDGKTFMNIQEAVQWLLDNNCIPFQCTANYQANTEIGLGTIVNPSPAKVRIGSLIFFADSKVSTVVGITETGFICSDKYNNLVDDIAYVTDVSIDASGHLITTLSDGQTIDAGIIKQVSNFSINASQHLIVTFNNGTTTDLGAIFSGNVNIAGNLTADSIIENMSGYTFTKGTDADISLTILYAGVVKNGNKITFAVSCKFTKTGATGSVDIGSFGIPASIGSVLIPVTIGGYNWLDLKNVYIYTASTSNLFIPIQFRKVWDQSLKLGSNSITDLPLNTEYYLRYEATFLLSENLAS